MDKLPEPTFLGLLKAPLEPQRPTQTYISKPKNIGGLLRRWFKSLSEVIRHSFRYRVEDGCTEGIIFIFREKVKLVTNNLSKRKLSLWEKKIKYCKKNCVLQNLAGKFHLKTSFVMHSM